MGDAGGLLLKSAVDLAATVAGSGVPGIWYLGVMADAQTANVSGFCGTRFLRRRLGDLYPSFP